VRISQSVCVAVLQVKEENSAGIAPGYSFYCSALGICFIVPNKLKQNGQADTIRYILICISMTFPRPG